MTLQDFAEKVLTPTVLMAVERGQCDKVIFDPELDEFYDADSGIMSAIIERRKALAA